MKARGKPASRLPRKASEPKGPSENGYNPCDHGYAAKAWECLRRNVLFHQRLEAEKALDAMIDEESVYDQDALVSEPPIPDWYRELKPNALATAAITLMICPPDNLTGPGIRISQGKTCKDAWTSLTEKEQTMIRKSLRPGRAEVVRISDENLNGLKRMEVDNLFLLVPRRIQHNAHRRTLLKQIDALLPKNRANTKWFKSGGRTLGTRRAWDAFLWFEKWRDRYGAEQALNLAALKVFGGFEASDVNKNAQQLARHAHFSTAKKLVDGIEKAIRSVYPTLDPYSLSLQPRDHK